MFPKSSKTINFFIVFLFWGCLFFNPILSFGLPDQVNINTATAEQLENLPGIGPDLAQRILDYRNDNGPFDTINGLLNVKGIGEGKLSKLRDQITVGNSGSTGKDPTGTRH